MARRRKLRQLLVLGGTLGALLLLSGALRSLVLGAGRPLVLDFSWLRRFDTYQGELNAEWLFVAMRLLVLISCVLFPIALVVALIDPEMRRRLLRNLLIWGMILLTVWALQNVKRDFPAIEAPQEEDAVVSQEWASALDAFTAPSSEVVWAVSFGVAVILLAAVGGVLWWLWRRNREELPLQLLAREAEVALDALRGGGELRDVIIHCYAEMERVVAATRGLQRQDAMTAREFERQLLRLGLPDAPVDSLVQLFEAARYGLRAPGAAEQERAIASLNAIAAACGESR